MAWMGRVASKMGSVGMATSKRFDEGPWRGDMIACSSLAKMRSWRSQTVVALALQPLTEAADVKMFHQLREDAVAEQDSSEPREIRQRRWHQAQAPADGRG